MKQAIDSFPLYYSLKRSLVTHAVELLPALLGYEKALVTDETNDIIYLEDFYYV